MNNIPERYRSLFNERQLTHIQFCVEYMNTYHHGAPGHLDMEVIGLLVDVLNIAHDRAQILADQIRDAGMSEDA